MDNLAIIIDNEWITIALFISNIEYIPVEPEIYYTAEILIDKNIKVPLPYELDKLLEDEILEEIERQAKENRQELKRERML